MTNTITRSDLGRAVYQSVGLSQSESTQLVEQVLEEISVWCSYPHFRYFTVSILLGNWP